MEKRDGIVYFITKFKDGSGEMITKYDYTERVLIRNYIWYDKIGYMRALRDDNYSNDIFDVFMKMVGSWDTFGGYISEEEYNNLVFIGSL